MDVAKEPESSVINAHSDLVSLSGTLSPWWIVEGSM